eukprot:CAMPEP_0172554842 /NCGR_PEP_ID=MMETSP1067-20121228/56666_1 /TAXON_ID=265564 ORGANISM="Thalassiosira punctigera, Strain Tpunct2005C2" /NCGR_SAMPLE_ID=MMETSP1067 /ASSEMBLY_ACC=CAM_ASM_000444 /LENGTH=588 /DNA_ID=CAMNT_0013343289 /DNA_START=259 /DNA_END=2025 /DNA_ORIENTATION=+
MSNANNFLQNMGMQMPIFAAATQQTTNSDDIDLHDIFADYFNEGDATAANNADLLSNALATAQQQHQVQQQHHLAQAQQQQAQLAANHQQQLAVNAAVAQQQAQQQQQQHQVSLPTGSGIKTAWHSGSLPAMHQQGSSGSNNSNSTQQPPAKRSRGEELFLPGQQQQQQQKQLGESSMAGQNNVGAVGGGTNGVTITPQQLALAASGVGALSNRLGFSLPNNANFGIGANSGNMMVQQQQQGISQASVQQQVATSGGITLPVGIGIKFGAGGNILPQAQAGMQAGGGLGNGVMTNAHSATAMAQGAVAVSNMQYGINPNFQLMDKGKVEDQMAAERRLRNREHAKRSRVRKKFMLESLQQQVRGLQDENSTLRMLVQKHIPTEALKIIDDCCSKSVLFATGEGDAEGVSSSQDGGGEGEEDKKDSTKTPLLRSDFSLIESLTSGQQNFVLSDPRLPDNPIVFASPGFYELTGYTREQVLGRNCRFLQGAGTDRKCVDVIRTAVANGTDATVCLLNYKADGTPFWNQLFVAALRDADNCIVNYVGVQTMIEPNAGASALEDKVNAVHPISVGVDGDDNDIDDNAKDAKD